MASNVIMMKQKCAIASSTLTTASATKLYYTCTSAATTAFNITTTAAAADVAVDVTTNTINAASVLTTTTNNINNNNKNRDKKTTTVAASDNNNSNLITTSTHDCGNNDGDDDNDDDHHVFVVKSNDSLLNHFYYLTETATTTINSENQNNHQNTTTTTTTPIDVFALHSGNNNYNNNKETEIHINKNFGYYHRKKEENNKELFFNFSEPETTIKNNLNSLTLSPSSEKTFLNCFPKRMTASSNADSFHPHKSRNSSNSRTNGRQAINGDEEQGKMTQKTNNRLSSNNNNHQHNPNMMRSMLNNNIDNSHQNIMNLRNRPLKAATAGANPNISIPSNTNISTNSNNVNVDVSSTTTVTTTKNNDNPSPVIRRRSTRQHQQKQQSLGQEQSDQSSIPTSSSTTDRSIRSFFPLRTIGAVCELFRSQLSNNLQDQITDNDHHHHHNKSTNSNEQDGHFEPDLTLLSIVIGIIETSLTKGLYDEDSSIDSLPKLSAPDDEIASTQDDLKKNIDPCHHNSGPQNSAGSYSPAEATPAPIVTVSNVIHSPLDIPIPTVFYENVESLSKKFTTHIKESIDLSKYPMMKNTNKPKTTRELITKISETILSNLHRSHYKDRAHLQTIYSYITENKLDCYGVAYTVLAACQILGLDDVRLVMSEDHAWVIFGDDETCEVTWHGKCGNDDRCGQPIPENLNCWLYLNGNSMICDRFMAVATLVSAMNLSINATQESEELAILQQQLLWILYDLGHLTKYPMALGNLGDLEDVCVHGRMSKKHPIDLFHEAIESAQKYYNDYHVYPYTYIGGYYFRTGRFKEALKSWADASQVIKKYNYTRDDEEIYKEFQEIANDLIPYISKYSPNNSEESFMLQDPQCFLHLLRFYDGLCAWEEDSTTPVLHIGWTKPIVSTISKFPYSTRSKVNIKIKHERNEKTLLASDNEDEDLENNSTRERRRRRAASIGSNPNHNNNNNNNIPSNTLATATVGQQPLEKSCENFPNVKNNIKSNNHIIEQDQHQIMIDEEKFSNKLKLKRKLDQKENHHHQQEQQIHNNNDNNDDQQDDIENDYDDKTNTIILTSKKFSGIKNLLIADKLNTSAIQLQLTAQSQVNINKRSRISGLDQI